MGLPQDFPPSLVHPWSPSWTTFWEMCLLFEVTAMKMTIVTLFESKLKCLFKRVLRGALKPDMKRF